MYFFFTGTIWANPPSCFMFLKKTQLVFFERGAGGGGDLPILTPTQPSWTFFFQLLKRTCTAPWVLALCPVVFGRIVVLRQNKSGAENDQSTSSYRKLLATARHPIYLHLMTFNVFHISNSTNKLSIHFWSMNCPPWSRENSNFKGSTFQAYYNWIFQL